MRRILAGIVAVAVVAIALRLVLWRGRTHRGISATAVDGGEQAGDDPWDAPSLEWATRSPPPEYDFATSPPSKAGHHFGLDDPSGNCFAGASAMFPVKRVFAFPLLALPAAAWAHAGHDHSQPPGWEFDPLVVIPLALALIIFITGWMRLSRRSKVDRRRSLLFVGGWAVLTLSLVSPLHQAGERSFAMHMIEHELIMLVATLLLAASHAGGVLAWGLPSPLRRSLGGSWKGPLATLWKRLTEPVTATIVQAVVMWLWHAPLLFDRALDSDAWHAAQHLSFVVASLLFWVAMLSPRRGGYLLSAACLFVTTLVEGALGALMALSQSPWYSDYAAMSLSGIGLDPTTDQQLAGLIMWIPGGVLHGAAALLLLYRWLKTSEGGDALRAH
jgi:cytochrome c oxidase assembly factor CtaG